MQRCVKQYNDRDWSFDPNNLYQGKQWGKKMTNNSIFILIVIHFFCCGSTKQWTTKHKELENKIKAIHDPLQESDCAELLFEPRDYILDPDLYKLNAIIKKKLYGNRWDFAPPGFKTSRSSNGCFSAQINLQILEFASRENYTSDEMFSEYTKLLDQKTKEEFYCKKILSYLPYYDKKYMKKYIDKYVTTQDAYIKGNYFTIILRSDGIEEFIKRVDYKNEGERVWRPVEKYFEDKKERESNPSKKIRRL